MQPQTYTAKIGRNFRDVGTLSPKVLLRDVVNSNEEQFRDHCWVLKCPKLSRIIPKTNKKSIVIQFDAIPKQYYSGKLTLTDVSNIKIIA